VNWALMLATVGLVLGFRSSSGLAAAYGIAVTATMVITTMLAYLVARDSWGVSRQVAGSLAVFFLTIEFAFFGANLTKFLHGGWFSILVGVAVYIALSTWKQGRALLWSRLAEKMYPFDRFLKDIAERPPYRVSGTAIFMTSNLTGTPPTLMHNLEHNRVLHERVILLTVTTRDVPYVPASERAELEPLGQGFFRLALHYGFMQEPDVPAALLAVATPDFPVDLDRSTFFLGIETLIPTPRPGMPLWRERLFVFLSRNAIRATSFFRIPPTRVVEIGIQVEL
jgi:KUP system potassium uptake protein